VLGFAFNYVVIIAVYLFILTSANFIMTILRFICRGSERQQDVSGQDGRTVFNGLTLTEW